MLFIDIKRYNFSFIVYTLFIIITVLFKLKCGVELVMRILDSY